MKELKEGMYKPKQENIEKLKEYLKKQGKLNILYNADNEKL